MRIFIAYRFSGADKQSLRESLTRISDVLHGLGHESSVFFRDEQNWGSVEMTSGEIIDRALARVKESDAILAIQQGDEKSEGLLLEVGYAKALGKKVVLAISNEAQRPFLRAIADQIIEFKTLEEFAEGAKQAF